MPEYDVTVKRLEKTFRVQAKNQDEAKEQGVDAFSYWFLDSQKDLSEIMNVEIHHVESD